MIRLTDEEIHTKRKELRGCKLDPVQYAGVFCQAQLKQVVGELEDFVCVDCSTPNFIHLVLPLKYWQALLKEIE